MAAAATWTVPDFAASIRKKYGGAYHDWSDEDLARSFVQKHPEYKDQVAFDAEEPKAGPVPVATLRNAAREITRQSGLTALGKYDQKPRSTLGRAWDTANEGLLNPLAEKLGMGPGVAQRAMTGRTSQEAREEAQRPETPDWQRFGLFAGPDAGETADALTSPVSLGTMAAGPAGRLPGALGRAARGVGPAAGIAFGEHGTEMVGEAGLENTPEAWQKRLLGAGMMFGAGHGTLEAAAGLGRAGRGLVAAKPAAVEPAPVQPPVAPGPVVSKPVAAPLTQQQAAPTPGERLPGVYGKETAVKTPDGDLRAVYRVVEADQLQPSHDPFTFVKNAAYPAENERTYHSNRNAQADVVTKAQQLDPDHLVNQDLTAGTGPSQSTPEGFSLGGNGRTMIVKRAYQGPQGEAYKRALLDRAGDFGLDPAEVGKMQRPVLDRMLLDTPPTPEGKNRVISALNKPFQKGMSEVEQSISAGRALSPAAGKALADRLADMGEDASLRRLMSEDPMFFRDVLVRDGIVSPTDLPRFFSETGAVDDAGKIFLENAVLGSVVRDSDLLRSMQASTRGKLERAIPSLLEVAGRQDAWNIVPDTLEAVRAVTAAKARNLKIGDLLAQRGMFGGELSPRAQAITRLLAEEGPRAVAQRFKDFADGARTDVPGQETMFGKADPNQVFAETIGAKPETKEPIGETPAAGIVERLNAAATEAQQRIDSRRGRLLSGIPVDDLADYAIVGAAKIAQGMRDFGQWSQSMVQQFGDAIREHLPRLWQMANEQSGQRVKPEQGALFGESFGEPPSPEQGKLSLGRAQPEQLPMLIPGMGRAVADVANQKAQALGRVATAAQYAPKRAGEVGGGLFGRPQPRGFVQIGGTPQEPAPSPRMAAILKEQDAGPGKVPLADRLAALPTNAKRALLDRFTDIRSATEDIVKRVPLSTEQRPDVVADVYFGGGAGKIQRAFLEYGDVIEAADKAGVRQSLASYLNLTGYLRGLNILNEKRAAEGKGPMNALEEQRVIPKQYTTQGIWQDLQALDQQLGPQRYAEVQGLASKIWDLNGQAWKMAFDSGLISREVYQQGLARGPEYIPLERIFTAAQQGAMSRRASGLKLTLIQQHVLRSLEGSERTNMDPFTASMEKHAQTIKEVARNEAAKVLRNAMLADQQVYAGMIRPLRAGEKPGAGMGEMPLFENGQQVRYELPKILADAMALADVHSVTQIASKMPGAILNFARGVFRTGATGANLAFGIPNVRKDVGDLALLSKAAPQGSMVNPKNWPGYAKLAAIWVDSLKHVVKQDDVYREFLDSGAAFSTLQKNIDPNRFLSFKRSGISRLNPVSAIERLNNIGEETTKVASYRALRGKGMGQMEAAHETRNFGGSPDFARGGANGGDLGVLFMFYNANVQGISRTLSRFRDNPKMLATTMAGMTAFSAALLAWNRQFTSPDDNKPELDHVAARDKSNYWVFLLPQTYQTTSGATRHRMVKIPKGHAEQVVATPIQALLDKMAGGNTSAYQTALDTASTLIPGSVQLREGEEGKSLAEGLGATLNPVLRVPAELLANRDFYRDTPVEPRRFENVESPLRYTPTTSPAMVKLGSVAGLSPLKLQHTLRNIVPGLGEGALSLIDAAVPSEYKSRIKEGDEAIGDMPVAGPVLRRFVGSPVDQQQRQLEEQFYRLLDRAQTAKGTLALLDKQGKAAEAERLVGDPRKLALIEALGDLHKASVKLREIKETIDQVGRDASMPAAQRKAAARELNANYMETLRAVTAAFAQ